MSDNRNDMHQEREELAEGESELVGDLKKGALAGLIATIPVAFLAVVKQVLDLIPQLNLVGILTALTSIPWNGAGWVALFVVGALLGVGFASLDSHVSDTTTVGEMIRGAFYGFLLAVILMFILIPLYGRVGTLGFALGVLGTCIVFGAVRGIAYERMKPEHVT
jgi:Na+-translocating ferredoxin:NAD+ oxidoreductase RnfD subunit